MTMQLTRGPAAIFPLSTLHNLLTQPGGVDPDAVDAAALASDQMPLDQRLAMYLQQWFGRGVGERAHAFAASGGEDHGACVGGAF